MIAEFLGLRERRSFTNASIENPQSSLNDEATYDFLAGGRKSAAGTTVSPFTAMSIAAVWQAIELIGGDVSKLGLYPYKRMAEDDREIAVKHPGYFPCAVRANDYKSAKQFWQDLMTHVLMYNNGYAFIRRNGGRGVMELINLLPDRTAPEWHEVGGEMRLLYVTEVAGKIKPLLASDVLHIRGLSLDGSKGCELVEYARDVFGLSLAARNFESKFFKNGARIGGTLEIPAAIGKPARDNIEDGFRKTYEEGDNPFKTVILREGAKFHAGQVTPSQGQVKELKEEDVREIARFFNLLPSRLGVPGSVSYNSFEQDNLVYIHSCLHHWADRISDECNMKLLSENELRTDSHYFEHNFSKFLQADWKTLNEGLEIQRRNEIINADEWRRKLNMNKRPDGKGGEYINPNTKSAAEPKPTEEKPKVPPKKPSNEAHRDLLVSALNRVARRVAFDARKASGNPQKFCAWLDEQAKEHRVVFDDSVRPAVKAYASVFGGDVPQMCDIAQGEFFDGILKELDSLTQPPYVTGELQQNVGKAMDHFERFAGERVAQAILEQNHESN